MDAIAANFGHIDALINHAAIAGRAGTLADGELAEWARVYDVDVYGAIRATRAVLPYLHTSAHACIVNTCSVFGAIGCRTEQCMSPARARCTRSHWPQRRT